ncbi:MAG: UDP-N-acetylmuramate--L-alanine ligase [bacterium]|nr:UDP-N-acetylmuramate--L-alanine ligase [bacterium]
MINFKNLKKVYCIGIGGIGVSALAQLLHSEGKEVVGSDREETLITKMLQDKRIEVLIGQNADNVTSDIDLVIYTPAVGESNPEFDKARELKIPMFSYPEALGVISREMFTIAVSGCHGKTTTTAMIGKILKDAERSPTVIVGSLLQEGKTNFVRGTSDLFVVEACEYKRSFLHLNPNILVITNIDNDHLDYYKDLADIQSAFRELAQKVPKDGFIVTNPNDPAVLPALQGVSARIVDYTLYDEIPHLKVPGAHNILNAKAALAAVNAASLDISSEAAQKALQNFTGTWRRFEYKGKIKNGAFVYDDYGHHPTEIKATLKAAKESFPDKKIIVVFQPHLYSRTKLLLNEFAKSFHDADEVIILPIYAAREDGYEGINSEILTQEIKKNNKNTYFFDNFEKIITYLKKYTKTGDLILTMGAGDIYKVGESLL